MKNIQIALTAVAILWLVYALNLVLVADLRLYGIHPRRMYGLWGIIFSPFLHNDLRHLTANTGAFFVLLILSLSFSKKLTIIACVIISLLGGGLVWIFGRSDTVHIGASGIIFGLIGFLMFSGIFRRELKTLFLALVVFLLYGGALYTLVVYEPGISWTGHFYGFIAGTLAAWWTKTELKYQRKKRPYASTTK